MINNENFKAIEIIITLLKFMKHDSQKDYAIGEHGSKYLLNQTLRQLRLPRDRYFVSIKADSLWKELTDEEIFNYYYQMKVTNKFVEVIKLEGYSGASSQPYDLIVKRGENFPYREVFHDDHIIPIKLIIERLISFDETTHENVMEVIRYMGICRMLKSEDRVLHTKTNRPFNEKDIINGLYKRNGITIKDYDY